MLKLYHKLGGLGGLGGLDGLGDTRFSQQQQEEDRFPSLDQPRLLKKDVSMRIPILFWMTK